jgi:hypothetical protein
MDYFPPGSPAGEVRGRGPTQVGATPRVAFRFYLAWTDWSEVYGLSEGNENIVSTREGLRHRYRGARTLRAIPCDGRILLRRAVRRSGAPA